MINPYHWLMESIYQRQMAHVELTLHRDRNLADPKIQAYAARREAAKRGHAKRKGLA